MNPRNRPEVSVLIPAYNASEFLDRTVESVQAQTFEDWELVIAVDPGSADQTGEMALAWAKKDMRIRVVSVRRRGVAAARNQAMQSARGDYLAFLDSDDLWHARKLETQLAHMKDHGSLFSCSSFRRIDRGERRQGRIIAVPTKITYARLLQQNCILCSSVVIHRNAVKNSLFREIGCEDYAFWLEILQKEDGLGCREDLVRYRIVSSSRGASKWRSLRETWQIWKIQNLSTIARSALLLIFLTRSLLKYARF